MKIHMKRILLLLFLLTTACAPLTAIAPSPVSSPSPTSTLTPKDRIATAVALDAATQTAQASITPVATLDPSVPTLGPIQHQGTQPGQMFWWNDTVFYEVFVRSFKDSNGDGVGDLNGLIEKLDYLNDGDPTTTSDLGVTGLWLMPIMESPSYHGYDVVDYYTVDQEYGTNEDFQHLMQEAHKRGIRVVVDLVINHTSSENPWFLASDAGDPQYRDWYLWAAQDPNYLGPWGEQVWHAGKSGYYYGIFSPVMPDLNLNNPAVTAEVDHIIHYWLTDLGVDGFRLDAVRHYVEQGKAQENTSATHAWLKNFYQYYKGVNPNAFTVGETWTDMSSAAQYAGDEVDVSFNFPLADAFVRTANSPLTSSASRQMQATLDAYPEGQFAVFLTNHDQNRVMSVLNDVDKARMAAVLLLTSPGVPFLYYGEEIGMTGVKPDEDIRRPMQWTGDSSTVGFTSGTPWRPAADDYPTVNVATQTDDPDSLLSLYRDLIHLRNDHSALRTGHATVIETGNRSVYALLRYNDEETLLVLVNVDSKPVSDYNLELESGAPNALTLLGLPNPSPFPASAGSSGWRPFAELPARSFAIIQLKP